jgi:hypothetical protein
MCYASAASGDSRTLDPHALRARVPLSLLAPLRVFFVLAMLGVFRGELLLQQGRRRIVV